MSTDKIALTASMRSNLLSLKNTQGLMDKTQDRLSTGYKVNSAMDNPSSYFTAQSLNSRADDLSTLMDSIGQAISTLEVADQGITSLQKFVEQAKSVANSARDTANVSAKTKSSIKFDLDNLKSQIVAEKAVPNAKANETMTIRVGDSTKLTGTVNVNEDSKLADLDLEVADAGSIVVDGKEYKLATDSATGNSMTSKVAANSVMKIVGMDGDTYTLADESGNTISVAKANVTAGTVTNHTTIGIGDTVTNKADATVTVSEDGKTTATAAFTLTANAGTTTDYEAQSLTGKIETTINVAKGSTVADFAKIVETMIGTKVFDASVEESNLVFKTLDTTSIEVKGAIAEKLGMDKGQTITLEDTDTAESLRLKINDLDGVSAEFDDKGRLVIKSEQGDDLVISGTLADKLGVSGAVTNGSNERATYAKQFDAILTQINELVQDTSYKGINLLNGDNLTVVFNEDRTSTLELKGVTFDATGLGFTTAKNEWIDNDSIDTALDQISKATSSLRAQASEFGQNLSTVQIREDFTENMVNQLTTGADKLTLADMNEEGANMLALQTRQQLGINSLSLASQASQSVLKLF